MQQLCQVAKARRRFSDVLHGCACREARWQLLQVRLMLLGVAVAEAQAVCVAMAHCAQLLAGQGYLG
jgi:hypothetical protein